jgi:hypothetical protein
MPCLLGYTLGEVLLMRLLALITAIVLSSVLSLIAVSTPVFGQDAVSFPSPSAEAPTPAPPKVHVVDTGTHVPLSLINSVSTRNSVPGDRVYLETVFPILVDGRIVIPPGSYVMGTITEIKRPGKLKGRGEFHLRFDSLTLPNGTTRDFRAQVSNLDGRATEQLDRKEGTIRSEGNKAGDAQTIAQTTLAGAGIGALSTIGRGSATGMGMGIGAAAGAATGLAIVLLSRGPDAVLAKGTTVEMVLDRQIGFEDQDLDFANTLARRSAVGEGPGPLPSRRNQTTYPSRVPKF